MEFRRVLYRSSLQALQHRVSLWIHRPSGRLAGLLLLVAMISAGLPTGNVHAHAGGDHDHDHSVQLAEEGSSGHEDPAPSAPAALVVHSHAVGTSVTAKIGSDSCRERVGQ